jgi:hypothetical protein
VALRVGVCAIFLDVVTVGAPQQLPIQIAQIVAGHVLAMLGEFGREASVRRAVQTRYEPFDYRARQQFERRDSREHFGRQKPWRAGIRLRELPARLLAYFSLLVSTPIHFHLQVLQAVRYGERKRPGT